RLALVLRSALVLRLALVLHPARRLRLNTERGQSLDGTIRAQRASHSETVAVCASAWMNPEGMCMWQDQPMGTAIGITMDTTTATQFRFLSRMRTRTTASRLRPTYIHPGRYTPPCRSVQHQ